MEVKWRRIGLSQVASVGKIDVGAVAYNGPDSYKYRIDLPGFERAIGKEATEHGAMVVLEANVKTWFKLLTEDDET